ncbi:dihydrofolate reductase family protein [Microbacterium elymi]|uniref:Dihydrofolate reductase family protein n=1 Tax=Microbacterium elymi TaxID=2909587 RepID=A0ABY5NKE0_9MICO|nr:dihydrofolate reductase family protein [Microbacterium elymi]UUT35646.1 dihydrofolate reductase family protein [Microbacterium elymi]
MTARFVYWMNVSVDLRIERDPDERGGGDWLHITENLHREFNARAAALSAMVQGRVIYDTMEAFWPNARDDESLDEVLREYGRIWTDKPKYLVSRTRTEAGHRTQVVGGPDAIERLARIRADGEGDIGIGGATIATQLLTAGLLDELMLFVHPVILSSGRPLFDPGAQPVDLELIEHARFEGDVELHRYGITRWT